ncbi:hypothetical protein ACQP1O_22225 [Nocardia sp. CA-151230]|uniref:hypothetical protein n=1 Tax=Nocardia sp. CA-151230 TaxID=3239982 RepID=UPI003D929BC7
MSEADPGLSLELVWDLIENTVSKAELRAALAAIDELEQVEQFEGVIDGLGAQPSRVAGIPTRAHLPARDPRLPDMPESHGMGAHGRADRPIRVRPRISAGGRARTGPHHRRPGTVDSG